MPLARHAANAFPTGSGFQRSERRTWNQNLGTRNREPEPGNLRNPGTPEPALPYRPAAAGAVPGSVRVPVAVFVTVVMEMPVPVIM